MNDKTDLFIKYLDNRLSSEEKKNFENEVSVNENLKNEFVNFSKKFNELKNNKIKIDDSYFNSLIPRAKKRIEGKNSTIYYKPAYLLPVIIIGLILYLTLFNNTSVKYSDPNYLIEEYVKNEESLVDAVNKIYSNDQDIEIDNNLFNQLYNLENQYDETVFDYLSDNVSTSDIENNFLNQMSDDEFNLIYNKMLQKKF